MRAVVLIVYVFGIKPHIQLRQPLLFVSGIAVVLGITVSFLKNQLYLDTKLSLTEGNSVIGENSLWLCIFFALQGNLVIILCSFSPGQATW